MNETQTTWLNKVERDRLVIPTGGKKGRKYNPQVWRQNDDPSLLPSVRSFQRTKERQINSQRFTWRSHVFLEDKGPFISADFWFLFYDFPMGFY